MQTIDLIQGSPEWVAFRATHYGASDAPAMMGCSSYKTRPQLLAEKASGITPEVDAATQARFDDGHRTEALARPIAERILGMEMSPVVGVIEGTPYSASFDGLDMDETMNWECKRINERLAAVMPSGRIADDVVLPLEYRVQMSHQHMVGDLEKTLFTAARFADDGTPRDVRHCWYLRDPELEHRIAAEWKQFEQDRAAYVAPAPAAPAAIGRAPETLPMLNITIEGGVQASNLPEFRERALWLIRNVKRDLVTDQDFADAEVTVKWCATIEQKLKDAKDRALAQTASISELFHAIDEISAEARRTRLDLDKLVKAEKLNRKVALGRAAVVALEQHVTTLNRRLGGAYIQPVQHFSDAIKGMSSLTSMSAALDAALANAKVEASQLADRVDANLRYLVQFQQYANLFPDLPTLALKAEDDFRAVTDARVLQAREAERLRLEAERERIRVEEEAKAKAVIDAAAAAVEKAQAAAAPAKPAIAIDGPFTVDTPVPAQATPPTLTLGAINERLAPVRIDSAGIASFRIVGHKTGRSMLYTEQQYRELAGCLIRHLQRELNRAHETLREAEAA